MSSHYRAFKPVTSSQNSWEAGGDFPGDLTHPVPYTGQYQPRRPVVQGLRRSRRDHRIDDAAKHAHTSGHHAADYHAVVSARNTLPPPNATPSRYSSTNPYRLSLPTQPPSSSAPPPPHHQAPPIQHAPPPLHTPPTLTPAPHTPTKFKYPQHLTQSQLDEFQRGHSSFSKWT
ncbi:hypothetical protein EJ04DRAFT_563718 [Polyplosphaeria fusca]|uniref:Uncharacterized protein n=1 Tax=Polyplosphaeria fusca TaxID=682080 RepID=A0A9P4V3D2_9PLEO|nr:hypothetical protein EJ04DRAFT_563718 [Polyplosphaeria fusca]